MKKRELLSLFLFIMISITGLSQSSFNQNTMKWTRDWTNFEPNNTNYPDYDEQLPNIIDKDTYLRSDIVYLMSGDIYVTNNATLIIQEGTLIKADTEKSTNLIVTKGAKLIADGSKASPIVFTSNKLSNSRKSGDWGGITIIGSGKANTVEGEGIIKGNFNPLYTIFGGNTPEEETTILRYVRIEYAGKSTNGLSLYALGNKSVVENIMVSYSADDSFEWHGGNSISKNLISYKSNDDDYDFTQGYRGELINILAIKHPYITSNNGSYAIEVDGYNKSLGFENSKILSSIDITGATLISLVDENNYSHTRAAISINNLGELYLNDSNISGFSDVVKLDKTFSTLRMIETAFKLDNSFFNIHKNGVITQNNIEDDLFNLLKYNRFTKTFLQPEEIFSNPLDRANPDFTLKNSLNNYMVVQ
ncbi:hypothetical protein [Aquimarina sp. 2201CG14-23]|uniref:hypothetical protein n=1 Tax=Aquimarina mycalae TaxID=3040073 RepID=UPI002477F434|nr:hypothetical protein [Aquimarina sp. 2201CG14-23]MDH7445300.1 hypothetical protein [Aquimarina sp. 2201CG14-23]